MAKAGAALKQVLKAYGISQNKLATTMGISHSNIHRWINEVVDPAGDSILEIRDALEQIEPEAAEEFTRLYWGRTIDRRKPDDPSGRQT
ncbi:MAG: helix-turn-helix transcriptional regulator [Leptolyngbyaceae cyanobacterium CRU_2_3]|nr:helix-turn-helix transcriptional regulator [Leptolyngbyaceae cyanobacterium CRU_2_3]